MAKIVLQIVLFNFIISEVNNSYAKVKESLASKLMQEKGMLICEAEDMLRSRFSTLHVTKWNHLFPKYLIMRQLDQ